MRVRPLLKYIAVQAIMVSILVAILLYCISPGEVEAAWYSARARLSRQALHMFGPHSDRAR